MTSGECRHCRHDRLREGHTPRKMYRLPASVTQHRLFNRKSTPVSLCPHCDGQALELALKNHKRRLARR